MSGTSRDFRATALVCLALLVGTAFLYAPVLRFDFVNCDDPDYVVNNFHVKFGLTRQAVGWAFQIGYAGNWHPLTWMSHMLDCQLFGVRAGPQHAVNVVLHTLDSMLLFGVLRRMTRAFWRSAMVAALFAWHPLHVESVAWISERKDVLSALFWMLTLWAYVGYADECKMQLRQPSRALGANAKCKIFYALALLFFALGLMAKPMLVTLPFVLLLLDWWPLGRLRFGRAHLDTTTKIGATRREESSTSPRPSPQGEGADAGVVMVSRCIPKASAGMGDAAAAPSQRVGRLVFEKTPFFILAAISCFITVVAQSRWGAIGDLNHIPLSERFINILVTYFRYVKKTIWPADLAIFYSFHRTWPAWEIASAAVFLIGISALVFRFRKAHPEFSVGWLWYLGTLVPVIGLVQVGAQSMADRYMYIPSIGLFVLVCWGAYEWCAGWRFNRLLLGVLGGVALIACLFLSSRQIQYWRSSATLLSHAIVVSPDNYLAHAGYASDLLNHNKLAEARTECEASIRIEPNYGPSHSFLSHVAVFEGKFDEAATEAQRALKFDPALFEPHQVLGQVFLARDQPAEAAAEFSIMLQANPGDPIAQCWLGKTMVAQGKLAEACNYFYGALNSASDYPEAHCQLAEVLASQGKTEDAISHYRAALGWQRNYPEALNNLAWILAAAANPEYRHGIEAIELARRACELTQFSQPVLIGTLAAAYAEAGRFDEAVASAQKAHDLAQSQGNKPLADRNLELMELYRTHQPYHEK